MIACDDSGDRVLCLAGAQLTLYQRGRAIATATAPETSGPPDLWLARDVVCLLDGSAGQLHLFDAALVPLGDMAITPSSRLLAASARRALLSTHESHVTVLSAAARSLSVAPVRQISQVGYACASSDGLFYVGRGQRLDAWDLELPRLLSTFRLVLDFVPANAGLAWDGRFIWFHGAGRPLETFRISDWQRRPQLAAPDEIRGSRHSRFVALRHGDEWVLVDVVSGREHRRLPRSVDLCVLPSSSEPALVVEGQPGELEWLAPIAEAEPPDETRTPPAPAPEPAASSLAEAAPAASAATGPRLSRWRAQLFGREAPSTPPPNAPRPAASATMTAPVAAPPAAAPRSEASPHEESWRDRLAGWKQPETDPPLGGTLSLLCERLALAPEAVRGVAFLYRRRLLGMGPPSPALMAAMIGGPNGEGWREALGQGELGRLGLLRGGEGRPRLSRTARQFLDGAEPTFVPLDAGPADAPPIARPELIEEPFAGRDPATLAAALAARVSSPLAWFHPPPPRPPDLSASALTARLHGRVGLFLYDRAPASDLASATAHPCLMLVDRNG